jgi:hypothetical protein
MNLDFTALYSGIIEYFQNNKYIAIALAGLLLLMFYRKLKLLFTLILIIAVIAGSLFLISNISDLGIGNKSVLVRERSIDLGLPK